jgi:ATP-binding cassette subfamily C (CFTR/MRP) protein 4
LTCSRIHLQIGIVGRTGAGKSSLTTALFRLSQPEGNIFIDGNLAQNLPLQVLRKGMSIIPQEPFLFFGSLRRNLDPFGEYNDHTLWSALNQVISSFSVFV